MDFPAYIKNIISLNWHTVCLYVQAKSAVSSGKALVLDLCAYLKYKSVTCYSMLMVIGYVTIIIYYDIGKKFPITAVRCC